MGTRMALLFVGALLHESHEEDEQDGSSRDADDNRNNYNCTAKISTDSDISVSDSHLGHYLVVETSDKGVQFGIDLAILKIKYLSTNIRIRGRKI